MLFLFDRKYLEIQPYEKIAVSILNKTSAGNILFLIDDNYDIDVAVFDLGINIQNDTV